jgi:hypothetical protein
LEKGGNKDEKERNFEVCGVLLLAGVIYSAQRQCGVRRHGDYKA